LLAGCLWKKGGRDKTGPGIPHRGDPFAADLYDPFFTNHKPAGVG